MQWDQCSKLGLTVIENMSISLMPLRMINTYAQIDGNLLMGLPGVHNNNRGIHNNYFNRLFVHGIFISESVPK